MQFFLLFTPSNGFDFCWITARFIKLFNVWKERNQLKLDLSTAERDGEQ